jgi:tetratricopeptide (TPR) repeat protein
VSCFDSVLDIEPENSDALYNKANSLATLGQHEQAIPLFDKALNVEPANVEILNSKAMTLHAICQYEEAISCFDDILAIQKENPEIMYRKTKTVIKQGNILDSINILRRIVEIDPIYREIIKKEMEFSSLRDNPLFKEIIQGKAKFGRPDEEHFQKSNTETKILENKF